MSIKKLTDVASIKYGYAFNSKNFTNDSSYPQIVRIRDIKKGFSKTYYNGEFKDEYIIHRGDLLLGMDGEFNIEPWKSEKALLNQRVCKVEAKEGIDKNYLYFALNIELKKIEKKTSFATVKHLSAKVLNNIELKITNFNEQIKISHILANILKSIDLKEKMTNQLDELIKARFVEMFGDPVINNKNIKNQKLGDVCFLKAGEFTSSKTISPVKTSINKYPCFGGNGIRGYVNNYTHQGNYSLIGRQGALCGNVKFATGKFRNTEHAILVSPKIEINSRWLFELLNLEKLNRFKSGAAQPGLAVKTLNEVTIPVPGLKLQNEFANFVQQVDKSKVAVQKSLDETQKLYDSLMQEYFG